MFCNQFEETARGCACTVGEDPGRMVPAAAEV